MPTATDRLALLAADPRCAITSFVRFHAKRGFRFVMLGDEEVREVLPLPTKDADAILRAVYEVEEASFDIFGADGKRAGWVYFLFPSALTCSPDESAADYTCTATTDAWEATFHA